MGISRTTAGALAWQKLLLLSLFLLFFSQLNHAGRIIELTISGSIGPATADYVVRGITKGQEAELIVIQLDTPGGLDKSTHQTVQSILMSNTPVVVYVAPNGARAASAGTFLIYASTVAAMAPATHLGAASPVNLLGDNAPSAENNNLKSTMDKKISNDALASIRALAQLRGRDLNFAEKAVLDATTLTAPDALKNGVIEIIAKNNDDLLHQLDGLVVTQQGRQIKLSTLNAEIERIQPDWRMTLLQVITDPTIAYLLLLLGIYGILFELISPGFVAPGVIGAIAILLALYALQLLPINYTGLILILLGIAFIIAEAFAPSFGALGIGGSIGFIMGSILLIDGDQFGFQIARSAICAMAAVNILFFTILMSLLVRSRRKPLQHGVITLVGAVGRALGPINPQGQAVIRGEIWSVHAKQPIGIDKRIKVIGATGLKLEVEELQGE